jgi:hypothetical protein
VPASNPGPILKHGAALFSTGNVFVETANAFVDTGEHNLAPGMSTPIRSVGRVVTPASTA